jgi:hypothetical protein
VLQLTPAALGQAGAVYSALPLPLASNAGFSTFFTFRLSHGGGVAENNGVWGADGICFVLQSGGYQLGPGGGGMGYLGVRNSLAVEFDTFDNGFNFGTPGDCDGNHVAINVNGTVKDTVFAHILTPMNNSNVWYAWVDYFGQAKRLEVRLSEIPVRPLASTLAATVDLPMFLGSTEAFAGFTGSTGEGWNQQDILAWKFLALPTTRITGQVALTNCSPDFYLTNGVAIKQYRYEVDDIWYTNVYFVTLTFTLEEQPDGTMVEVYESVPESSPIPPFEFQYEEFGYGEDTLLQVLLGQYMDYLVGTGQIEGVSVFAGSDELDIAYDLIDRLSGEDWTVSFAGLDEGEVNDVLSNCAFMGEDIKELLMKVASADLYQEALDEEEFFELIEQAEYVDMAIPGDFGIPAELFTYSTARYRGHAFTREQVVLAPSLPIKLLAPHIRGGTNFQFWFRTVLNQSYTVRASTNVAATHWVSYTNFTGDGYLKKITAPATDSPRRFYRVSSP